MCVPGTERRWSVVGFRRVADVGRAPFAEDSKRAREAIAEGIGGLKFLHAIGGLNRTGSHGQIFFSAPKKSASARVFPVRDERSNLPAEAVERQAIWYWRSA
jgi:hypothetical protein